MKNGVNVMDPGDAATAGTVVGTVIGTITTGLFSWWKFRKKTDSEVLTKTQTIQLQKDLKEWDERRQLGEEQRKRIASLEAENSKQTGFWTGKLEALTERFDARIKEMDKALDTARDETYRTREQLAIQSQMVTFAQEKLVEFQKQIELLKKNELILDQKNQELEYRVTELARLNEQKDAKIAAQDAVIKSLEDKVAILEGRR